MTLSPLNLGSYGAVVRSDRAGFERRCRVQGLEFRVKGLGFRV